MTTESRLIPKASFSTSLFSAALQHLVNFAEHVTQLGSPDPAPITNRWGTVHYSPKVFLIRDTSDLLPLNQLPGEPIGALFLFAFIPPPKDLPAWILFAEQFSTYLVTLVGLLPSLQHVGVYFRTYQKDLVSSRVALRKIHLLFPSELLSCRLYTQSCKHKESTIITRLAVCDFIYNKLQIPRRAFDYYPLSGHIFPIGLFSPAPLQSWIVQPTPTAANIALDNPIAHPLSQVAPSDHRLLQADQHTLVITSRITQPTTIAPFSCAVLRNLLSFYSSQVVKLEELLQTSPSLSSYSSLNGPTPTTEQSSGQSHRTNSSGLEWVDPNQLHGLTDYRTNHMDSQCPRRSSTPDDDEQLAPNRTESELLPLPDAPERPALLDPTQPPASLCGTSDEDTFIPITLDCQPNAAATSIPCSGIDADADHTRTPTILYVRRVPSRTRVCRSPISLLGITTCLSLMVSLTTAITFKEATFVGYDCSRPENKTIVQSPGLQRCQVSEPIRQDNRTYLLLQEAQYTRLSGKKCHIRRSQLAFRDGAYDHMTFVPWMFYLSQVMEVSKKECQLMWDKKVYIDPNGGRHELLENGTALATFYAAGGCNPNENRDDVICKGEEYTWLNKAYTNMVVFVQLDIILQGEEIVADNTAHTIMVHSSELLLPCRLPEGGCIHPTEGTFLWDPNDVNLQCPLYQLRITKGVDIVDKQGDITYISQDGSMVRLDKRDPQSTCQEVVFQTQYPRLFISEQLHHAEFQRPLHPSELSTITYANQQDSFLYGELTALIKKEYSAVRHQVCLQKIRHQKGAYAQAAAEQKVLRDGETVFLGEGWFALASGEVWYRYLCRPLQVTAINKEICYDSLPVQLSRQDLNRYLIERRPVNTDRPSNRFRIADWLSASNLPPEQDSEELDHEASPEFFLEPHSHLLVTIATPLPCSPEFAPVYKNAYGQAIMASPSLRQVPQPPPIYDPANGTDPFFRHGVQDFDFNSGGIYTAESVKKMENYVMAPRATRGLTARLTYQAHGGILHQAQGTLLSSDLFDDVPNFSALMPFLPVWKFLLEWGSFCSAIFGVIAIFRILTWIGGVLLRLVMDFPLVGCSLRLCLVCCPTARDYCFLRSTGQIPPPLFEWPWNRRKSTKANPTTEPPAASPSSHNIPAATGPYTQLLQQVMPGNMPLVTTRPAASDNPN